ncbi:MAG TPA: zinc ribbon domain-containing protein [Gemmatimonadales bacterium]|nr:zinc ribbon domain-containing protein [Gemmatimonadales bacterium]
MPTYDYQCSAGHNFEKIHKMSESPRVKCPICGKPAARQISGGAGLVFKGSGFYITDYGKDGKGARKAETAEGTGSSAAKADAAAPAAPAKGGKTESKAGKDAAPKSGGSPKKAAE